MKRSRMVAVLLSLLVFGTFALAQVHQGDSQVRARLRNNINTLRLLRMTEALNLTEEQTAKLFPALTKIEKEKLELQRQMGENIQDLRTYLNKAEVRDEEVLQKVKAIRELRQEIRGKDEEVDAVLDANLTPVQKGKYMLFLVDFARGLGETLNRARGLRGRN
jgi:Spy/CpxP family protein refolding chaperone